MWSLIGLFIGLFGTFFMQEHKKNIPSDIFLSVLGAIEAGYLYHALYNLPITYTTTDSFMLASGGAVGLLFLQRFFSSVSKWSKTN